MQMDKRFCVRNVHKYLTDSNFKRIASWRRLPNWFEKESGFICDFLHGDQVEI